MRTAPDKNVKTNAMDKETREEIIKLMRREIVPAMGCTEPAAVALCVAKASELLGRRPEHISLWLSGNMIKNAMGVGIPGTGMIGLPIAVALGAICGKSEYGLEVLRDVNDDYIREGSRYIDERRIEIKHTAEAPSNLYVEVNVISGDDSAMAIISGSHTNFIYMSRNDEVLYNNETCVSEAKEEGITLNERMVYDFSITAPIEEIEFMEEAGEMNLNAAKEVAKQEYGHSLGSTIHKYGKSLFGDGPLEHMLELTSAACDARMGGATVSVMSNSGSGNQGITATLPVLSYAREINADRETTVRALTLSGLTSIYIKQSLGRLSALCGCVVASTAASAGLVYLMGGGYEQICAAIKNMVANLTGMICDGAKPSCSMKISSGVYTALMSAMLAMHDKCVTSAEGIISDDIDDTIRNLTSIGRESMQETDRHVLKIMINK